MRRGWLVAGAAALVGLWVLMRPSSEGPDVPVRATPPPVVALVVSRHPSLALLGDLGLDDAERYSLTVLDTGTRDLLIVYPEGVDPIETAARWSLVVVQAGYRKTNDWSRPGRTVLRFADEEMSVLLAVGRTTKGPFVLCSHPARREHWALLPDDAAPRMLLPLLPKDLAAARDVPLR